MLNNNLSQDESEIITMFGFEWNKEEERQALIEISEARGEKRGEARGEARGETRGIKIGKISTIRDINPCQKYPAYILFPQHLTTQLHTYLLL